MAARGSLRQDRVLWPRAAGGGPKPQSHPSLPRNRGRSAPGDLPLLTISRCPAQIRSERSAHPEAAAERGHPMTEAAPTPVAELNRG